MVEIKNLKKEDVERKVIYEPDGNQSFGRIEEGAITSWNDTFVFVRYGADTISKATRPEDLDFVSTTHIVEGE